MNSPAQATIEQVETTQFRLQMKGALQWGQSSMLSELHHVLVSVHLSNGATGYAEAPPRPTIYGETASSICSIVQEELAPRVMGMPVTGEKINSRTFDPTILAVQRRLQEVKNNYAAKGAIDMALHHALAESLELSLAEYLGATQERILVSYILGIGDRDAILAEAARVVQEGVRVLKVKVGRNWGEDVQRIRELQESLGSEVALYADANETMTTENARPRLDQLAEMGVLYCEEPLPVQWLKARAELQSEQHLPIIADDSTFTLGDLHRELESNTYTILNIKTARTGYTESLQMLTLNRAADKGCMVGSQASAGLGTARAAVFAGLEGVDQPSELSFPLKLEADIVNHQLPIRDGCISLADAAAVRVNADLLRAAAVK